MLHLLYARFFHKTMRDAGLSQLEEPFKKLLTQGMVCKEIRKDGAKKAYFNPSQVETETDSVKGCERELKSDSNPVEIGPVEKMSVAKYGVDPEELIKAYMDTVRLYTMFACHQSNSEWSDTGRRRLEILKSI